MGQHQLWRWVTPANVAFAIAFFGLLIVIVWGILFFYDWCEQSIEKAQRRIYEGLAVFDHHRPDLVLVVFHSYYGFIVFVTQTEHRFWASPEEARLALWRLCRFNIIWGLFAYGALIIPLISYANYLLQRRSIRKQEKSLPA